MREEFHYRSMVKCANIFLHSRFVNMLTEKRKIEDNQFFSNQKPVQKTSVRYFHIHQKDMLQYEYVFARFQAIF